MNPAFVLERYKLKKPRIRLSVAYIKKCYITVCTSDGLLLNQLKSTLFALWVDRSGHLESVGSCEEPPSELFYLSQNWHANLYSVKKMRFIMSSFLSDLLIKLESRPTHIGLIFTDKELTSSLFL